MSQLTGAAVIGLSLTYPNLEEVQTERREEGKNQKKKPTQSTQTYTKTIYTAGAASRTEGREKGKTKHKFSPEHSWIFLLNQMALDDNTRNCLY